VSAPPHQLNMIRYSSVFERRWEKREKKEGREAGKKEG
jgi:hypothetical protein